MTSPCPKTWSLITYVFIKDQTQPKDLKHPLSMTLLAGKRFLSPLVHSAAVTTNQWAHQTMACYENKDVYRDTMRQTAAELA